jgi:HlyD family secretion protein
MVLIKKHKAFILCLCLVIGAGAFVHRFGRDGGDSRFRTAALKRGDLEVSISATGTVEPEELIDVGAQVAGKITSFGIDRNGKTVDYGSFVEEGTVLANIDDALYGADVDQAQAQLRLAQANLMQAQAKFAQAERDWQRAQKLGPSSDALARTSYDSYLGTYETAKAGVAVSEADIGRSEAALRKAQRNLSYCTIKSPVNGVIIDRRVNIGQTVVSSLNAPSLFLIARDLKRIQVWVAVNEADIGSIFPGQKAAFTVDAFPGEAFTGQVAKIRLNASMTQNVVTYTVELVTDNSSGRLLPYLTANVRFEVNRRKDALLAPNAALRWTPKPEYILPETKFETRSSASEAGPGRGRVWVPSGAFVRPVRVAVGPSDGADTSIESGELKEGSMVVVGDQKVEPGSDNAKNPFAPQFPGMKGKS